MTGVHSKTPEQLRADAMAAVRATLSDLVLMRENLKAAPDWITAEMLGYKIEFPKYRIRELLENRINSAELTLAAYERETSGNSPLRGQRC